MSKLPNDSTYPRPGYLIYRASRLFVRLNEQRLSARRIGAGQIPVIVALGLWGSHTQKSLAEVADVEQPTMASLLARMERDGLIQRLTDQNDRRSSQITLTSVGEDTFPEVIRSLEDINEQAYYGFSIEERTLFATMVQRMINNLQAAEKKAKISS